MSLFVCYICGNQQFSSYLSFKSHMTNVHWKAGSNNATNMAVINPANYQLEAPSEGSWSNLMARWYICKILHQDERGFPTWHPTLASLYEACSLFEEVYRRQFREPVEAELQLTADNFETTFYSICDEVFRYDGRINTGRILAVFWLQDVLLVIQI